MIFRLILALCVFATPGFAAAQPLVFRDKVKDLREESVISFLAQEELIYRDLPYQIAATDLNYDGVDEWVVQQDTMSGCESAKTCHFAIVGLKKNSPALLGMITAGKIAISDDKHYGIRTLDVYNKVDNDFEFTRYRWNPTKQAFAQ